MTYNRYNPKIKHIRYKNFQNLSVSTKAKARAKIKRFYDIYFSGFTQPPENILRLERIYNKVDIMLKRYPGIMYRGYLA